METWKAIPSWPYEVSSAGQVRRSSALNGRTRIGKLLKPQVKDNGYLKVFLCLDGKVTEFLLNRLVCIAFHGPAPTRRHQAAHIDGNHKNNTAKNLYWATPIQNSADTIRHGRSRPGEKSNLATISDKTAIQIRRMNKTGKSTAAIAGKLKIPERIARRVIEKVTFRHLLKKARPKIS